ncbi:MAG TPA: hypothetical protein ENO31_04045 [Thermoprotei archaeon]|nr:hypothetical protein [TACK group archaeon]HEV51683.1 hypothetical protein [Thermoprotei archaeon]
MAVVQVSDGASERSVLGDCLYYLHKEGNVSIISEGTGMEVAIKVALSIVRSFDNRALLGDIQIFTEERNEQDKKRYVSKLKIDINRKPNVS